MVDTRLTVELLATALRGLENTYTFPAPDVEAPDGDRLLREIAERALTSVAVCLKFLLAKYGEMSITGFGTFSVSEGEVIFQPEEDLLQYVVLSSSAKKHRDEVAGKMAVRHLGLASSLIGSLKHNLKVEVAWEPVKPTDKLLRAIFGGLSETPLNDAVDLMLFGILLEFAEGGVPLNLVSLRDVAKSQVPTGYNKGEPAAKLEAQSVRQSGMPTGGVELVLPKMDLGPRVRQEITDQVVAQVAALRKRLLRTGHVASRGSGKDAPSETVDTTKP